LLLHGELDLIRDPDGDYWFLECNNGMWGMVQHQTHQPISRAFARLALAAIPGYGIDALD
jgi:hypothetical protein